MVDVENKIVYFGYGDVAVGSDSITGRMSFENIKPPQEIGSSLDGKQIEYGEEIIVSEKHTHELYNLFKTVSEDNMIVEYDGITFNFEKYDQKSVEVCLKHAWNTVWYLILAC